MSIIRMPHNVVAGDAITTVGATAPSAPVTGATWLDPTAAATVSNLLYGPNGEIMLHVAGAGSVGRITRLAGPQEDVHLRAGDAVGSQAMVESAANAFLVSNAYWDGANWYRFDIAAPSCAFVAIGTGIRFNTAAAGVNPITWTTTDIPAASLPSLPHVLDPSRCRVAGTTAQTIAASTFVPLIFQSAEYNTAGAVGGAVPWAVGTPSRMYARRTGLHAVGGGTQFLTSTGGTIRRVCMAINGTQKGPSVHIPPMGGSNSNDIFVSTEFRLTAGDYVEVMGYNDVAGGLNCNGSVGWLRWVSD
jgi:hypothetical protein